MTSPHRQLTTREARIRREYTKIVKFPSDFATLKPTTYRVRFSVGGQSFMLDGEWDKRPGAQWHRTMLACALAKIEL